MTTWAVIPAKCFDRAKSRLAPVASDAERRTLAEAMFQHVLGVATTHGAIAGVLVVTDCDEVDGVARAAGARVNRDARPGLLGASIDAALRELPVEADAAVILMGDLPRLRANDIDSLLMRLAKHSVVIAPDSVPEGTNALALRLPAPVPTAFGMVGSSAEHVRRFAEAGIVHDIYLSSTVQFDVDSPADLANWRASR
jgi:2-phospho-L-lactate guanylyltransferase